MVRLVPLSLLALFAGVALAQSTPEQQVLDDASVELSSAFWYTDCGGKKDPVQIDSITVLPDPPKPGGNLTVTVVAVVTELIEEGAYAVVTVKLGLIKLLTKQFDVCAEARKANASIQCPVQPGDYVVSHTVTLPKEIPPAKFTVDIRGYTVDDEDMVCLNLKVNFMKPPFAHAW